MKTLLKAATAFFFMLATSSCLCSGAGNASGLPAVTSGTSGNQASASNSQEKVGDIVEFDKMIHNFGDVMLSDGPLSCTFTLKNISGKPVVIYNVVTSCGCTDVKWTREPIMPGKTGTISSTYSNDEGPYPFDKTLTAYISNIGKPVILRLRGISHDRQLSLEEMYPERFADIIGIKSLDLKCGNVEQGEKRSDEVNIANLTSSPADISFTNVSNGLSVSVSPNPVPARSVARLQFTVTADRQIWGKNLYHATPVINGKDSGKEISVYAFTKENFSRMSNEQRMAGARPIFTTNTFSAGKIKAGTKVEAIFNLSNVGKEDFKVYKIDIDNEKASAETFQDLKSGLKGNVKVHLDTGGMPEGEMLVTCTLTTNSPARPIINLFITGWIE